jgi:hypothetical protein
MNRTNANHKSNQSNPTSPAYQQVNNNRSNQGNGFNAQRFIEVLENELVWLDSDLRAKEQMNPRIHVTH